MNLLILFFFYLDIAIGYGEGQNRTICGLKNWVFALWSQFASLFFSPLVCDAQCCEVKIHFRAVCLRGQTPQTFTGISRVQTGFLVKHYVRKKKISSPGGGNCPPPCSPLCTALHFAITYGERPLPMKEIKSLRVSFFAVGFFHEGCCMLVGWVLNE